MKYFLLIALLLTGCEETFYWKLENVPTTDIERELVAKHAQKILSPPPASLSGDPDWDDSIVSAHEQARKLYCKPTLWEYSNDSFNKTGRWKYITDINKVEGIK